MRNKSELRRHALPRTIMKPAALSAAIALAVGLTACGPSGANATPTMSVEEIYTAAFQTITAQQATQLALTPPTSTATNTPFPTLPPVPTSSTSLPFGTSSSSVGGGVQGCDSSVYVNDVTIPDGTVMPPGKSFTKTWTLMNNGTCPWTTSYKIVFVSGDDMSGASASVPTNVPAGQQAQISVKLTAPDTAGDYTGSWRLQNDKGQPFGNIITVVIKVSGSGGATDTPGAATETATATLTPTP